jgi:hypothetical protein
MTKASSLAYRLRPNKAVDRELFVSLLGRLAAALKIEKHAYVGLGGAFLEEFRLLHARTGIADMVCVEQEKPVHERQKFNRPIATIRCVHACLEDYLDEAEFDKPVVLWLDYTEPGQMRRQIDCFCSQVAKLPLHSVVRVTLNANPSSLGTPDKDEISISLSAESEAEKPTLQDWRLQRLRERLAEFVPVEFSAKNLETRAFGPSLIGILRLALDRSLEGYFDRKPIWAFSTHYSDGQPMVTATVIVVPTSDTTLESIVKEWSFRPDGDEPLVIDLPALSTRERLTLEASTDPANCLGYELPKSSLKTDPLVSFISLYRVFPHFATVDL